MNAECSTVVVLGEGAHAPAMEAPDWLDSTEAAPATPSPPELGLGATMPVREPHAGAEAPSSPNGMMVEWGASPAPSRERWGHPSGELPLQGIPAPETSPK